MKNQLVNQSSNWILSKINTLIFIVTISILISSCNKDPLSSDDGNKPVIITEKATGAIDIASPKVGQSTQFAFFYGTNFGDQEVNDYFYTKDTLKLEIIAKEDGMYKIQESILKNSEIYTSINNSYIPDFAVDNIYYLKVDTINQKVTLYANKNKSTSANSHLFGYFDSLELSLNENSNTNHDIKGWKIFPILVQNTSNYLIKNWKIRGKEYSNINAIVDYRAMANDGPGKNYIYSKKHGLLRFTTISPMRNFGKGWDLISTDEANLKVVESFPLRKHFGTSWTLTKYTDKNGIEREVNKLNIDASKLVISFYNDKGPQNDNVLIQYACGEVSLIFKRFPNTSKIIFQKYDEKLPCIISDLLVHSLLDSDNMNGTAETLQFESKGECKKLVFKRLIP